MRRSTADVVMSEGQKIQITRATRSLQSKIQNRTGRPLSRHVMSSIAHSLHDPSPPGAVMREVRRRSASLTSPARKARRALVARPVARFSISA